MNQTWSSKITFSLLRFNHKVRSTIPYQALEKTFAILFPFVLIGSLSQTFERAFFSKDGFFAQIYGIESWLPGFEQIHQLLRLFTSVTLGMTGLYAAFLMARYVAKAYNKDEQIAALTGAMAFLILNISAINVKQNAPIDFTIGNFGFKGLFIGLAVGALVGQTFKYLAHENRPNPKQKALSAIAARGISAILPVSLILLFFTAIIYAISFVTTLDLTNLLYSLFRFLSVKSTHAIVIVLSITFFNNLLWGIGLAGPLSVLQNGLDDISLTTNLNYALKHGTAWGAPYRISLHTLYDTYGNFGGNGMTLALIVAILFVSRNQNMRSVAQWSILPGIVNINYPLIVGLPVILNPILMIPFILTPLVTMSVGYVFLRLNLIPPAVYLTPVTTPAPLIAYLGTGGSLAAFGVSVVNLMIAIFMYVPFVRILDQADELEVFQ